MPVESEVRLLPDDIEPFCPICKEPSRKLSPDRSYNDSLYHCKKCNLNFEATIEIRWSKNK